MLDSCVSPSSGPLSANHHKDALLSWTPRVSRQSLVLQNVQRLLIQWLGMGIENGGIPGLAPGPFHRSQILAGRAFHETGAIGIDPIDLLKKVLRRCDRTLDPHKTIVPPEYIYFYSAGARLLPPPVCA